MTKPIVSYEPCLNVACIRKGGDRLPFVVWGARVDTLDELREELQRLVRQALAALEAGK